MLRKDYTWPKSDPKTVAFTDLPKSMQDDMLKTAQMKYQYNVDKLKSLVESNRIHEELLRKDVEQCFKHLACKHTYVEHDKSSGITDNTVVCKECGLNWSDY